MNESTFSKQEIEQFLLNTGNSFASLCWANDINEDRATYIKTAKWFQRFFPSNQAQYLFRLAECECIQEVAF